VVPNSGRDIGPFITEFGAALLQYDVIGHFHTKKSLHVNPNSNLVRNWGNHLMETLLGEQHQAAGTIIAAFANDPKLGLVFADDPHLIGWDKNLPFAKSLSQRLGLSVLPEQFFSFPVGTMFWARPAALKALFELGLKWNDYPTEPLPIDGSMLHALERLLPSIVECAGYRRKVTYASGITR
jgi:lipopolysaccharide biosynthesis protein